MQPSELTPAVRESALRLSIVEGAMASVFFSITANGLVTGLALYLGAGPLVLGVLGALPFITQLFQLLGAYLDRLGTELKSLSDTLRKVGRYLLEHHTPAVPADVVDNERRIAEATAKEEGKPEAALPKIVEGRVQGFFKESVLLEQPSVIDNKKTVGQVLTDAGTEVTAFASFEVGQG